MVKKRICLAVIVSIVISFIPVATSKGEAPLEEKETVIPNGYVEAPLEEVWVSEPCVLDKYYIPWADKWITLDEFRLICITTACEGGCSWDYQKRLGLIAKAIINRYASGEFGETIHDVIYAPSQFNVTEWYGFPDAYEDRVTDAVEVACFEAIASDFVPHDMYYFNSIGYFSWAVDYDDDGVMFFSRKR